LQTFDCDTAGATNSQKFNVVSDGTGYYTISPAHSDLCLEVAGDSDLAKAPIQQNACAPGKTSQKWAMAQYGVNLEIRAVVSNQCMDVMRGVRKNYGEVNQHPCNNGTNQRWTLHKTTLNQDGAICRASLSHPEHDCYGVNDQQARTYLGKTLTKSRCEEVCAVNKMLSCQWETSR
jgi:hypothetical protein